MGQAEPGEISLADAAASAATVQGRGNCACQQDGPRRLGIVGQRSQVSRTPARGSDVSVRRAWQREDEIASVRSRTARVMMTLMRNGSRPSIGKPAKCHARKERVLLVGTDQRITSGPAARTAALKGRIHGCTRTLRKTPDSPLAPRAPSIHGTSLPICYGAAIPAAIEGNRTFGGESTLEGCRVHPDGRDCEQPLLQHGSASLIGHAVNSSRCSSSS